MYPRVVINLKKFRHNVQTIKEEMDQKGIGIYGVSKVFCGDPMIAHKFELAGLEAVGESRIDNLKKLQDLNIKKVLLRLPMQSEIRDLVAYVDISLNSEIKTLELISMEAVRQGKVHGVILMIDFGDLREGFYDEEELYAAVKRSLDLEGVEVIGIGTNLTCFGAIIPKLSHMTKLVEIRDEIMRRYGLKLEVLSGGNSSSYYLISNEDFPKEINNLRIGEIFVCGNETAYSTRVPETYDDVFVLQAEIIELKEKPSLPIGESGVDAFGQKPVYTDKGNMLRAILATGRQDVGMDDLVPIDDGIEILGSSSDHLILDMTHAKNQYQVGDTISFKLKYGGILGVMTSKYVKKVYVE